MAVNICNLCREKYGFYDKEFQINYNEKKDSLTLYNNDLNIRLIIKHLFPTLRYSIFHDKIFLGTYPMDKHIQHDILIKVEKFLLGPVVNPNILKGCIESVGIEQKFNPLKEALDNIVSFSDETSYLDSWLIDICGTEDTEINRIIGRKWLISAVARACNPGCYVEGSLILYGEQAAGKSWLFKNLNLKEEYYCSAPIDFKNIRNIALVTQGKHVIELAELSDMKRSTLEDIKSFLTSQYFTYEEKYQSYSVDKPKSMVFGGSTNDPDILEDKTGNRRFWCVGIKEINQELFLNIKNNLWSEAYRAYLVGESWILTKEERELLEESNSQFGGDDPIREFLIEELDKMPDNEVSALQLKNMLSSQYIKVSPKTTSSIMQSLGWKRKQKKGCSVYVRPETSEPRIITKPKPKESNIYDFRNYMM